MKKILLLGSGELGKEFVIAAKRKGVYVVACDRYAGAPAMQVADECETINTFTTLNPVMRFGMQATSVLQNWLTVWQPSVLCVQYAVIATEVI